MLIHYFPQLYEYFINSMHPARRYELVGEIIGDGSVLDIGCGTGLLTDYISPDADYRGIVLNERLLNYARNKGLKVEKMDCRDMEDYPNVEVYFICDLLHHINPDHGKLVRKLVSRFRDSTIIACEPYAQDNWYYEQLVKFLDYDYVNGLWRPDWYEKGELEKFFRKELKADRIKEIQDDLVGINETYA